MKYNVSDTTATTAAASTTTTNIIITKVPYWTLSEATSIQLTSSYAASVRTYMMHSPIHVILINVRDVSQRTL
jgi:hypothetical protein